MAAAWQSPGLGTHTAAPVPTTVTWHQHSPSLREIRQERLPGPAGKRGVIRTPAARQEPCWGQAFAGRSWLAGVTSGRGETRGTRGLLPVSSGLTCCPCTVSPCQHPSAIFSYSASEQQDIGPHPPGPQPLLLTRGATDLLWDKKGHHRVPRAWGGTRAPQGPHSQPRSASFQQTKHHQPDPPHDSTASLTLAAHAVHLTH